MTNEEKYQLIINFINKLIESNEGVNVVEQYDTIAIQKNDFEGHYPLWSIILKGSKKMSFSVKAEARLNFDINNIQFIEFKYKFNQLNELSEKRAIKILNEQ